MIPPKEIRRMERDINRLRRAYEKPINLLEGMKMAFTDEDLERLKEVINRRQTVAWTPGAMRDLLSLLARLAAAERVAEMSEGEEGYRDVYYAWLRASGKDGTEAGK